MRVAVAKVKRAFVLEWTNGRYKVTPLSTVGELQFQLLSTQRTMVLPGQLDEATIQALTSYGVPHELLKAHLEGTGYSWRGSRPEDDTAMYFWEIFQSVRCCGKCTTEDFEYITDSRGPVVLLRVTLWVAKQRDISVLLVQQSTTSCQETEVRADPSLEDELREKLPNAGLNVSVKDYINQLAYERCAEYIFELRIETTTSDLIWDAMCSIEQNLDTARRIALDGDTLYLADKHAWEDLLRRLERRMRHVRAYRH
ncbi:hypothetical protein V8C35DRAFT_332081 [Trichoderma chlorosporum]